MKAKGKNLQIWKKQKENVAEEEEANKRADDETW